MKLGARVQAEDVNDRAWLWLRVDGADGVVLLFESMHARPIVGTRASTRHEVELVVPDAGRRLVYGYALPGGGAIIVRDVLLEVRE